MSKIDNLELALLKSLEQDFEEDCQKVFGDRLSRFSDHLKELLWEMWLCARARSEDEWRAQIQEEVENTLETIFKGGADRVGFSGDFADSLQESFEDRLMNLIQMKGDLTLWTHEQNGLFSSYDYIPVFMDKHSGLLTGFNFKYNEKLSVVETRHQLAQDPSNLTRWTIMSEVGPFSHEGIRVFHTELYSQNQIPPHRWNPEIDSNGRVNGILFDLSCCFSSNDNIFMIATNLHKDPI